MNINEYEKIMVKYSYALDILSTNMRILIDQYERENEVSIVDHTKVRLKTYDSSIKKLIKKGYDVNEYNLVNHIHDLVGIRIVCPFINDVYTVIDFIKKYKNIVVKEEKDYIASPKSTGYMSYHLIVKVPIQLKNQIEYIEAEIQVRTMAMDFWASLDHRLQYKLPDKIPDSIRNDIYNCAIEIQKVDDKMLELRDSIEKYVDTRTNDEKIHILK